MLENPILVFVVAVLAVPGVTSLLTSAIRWLADNAGIPPRVSVYVASIALTGAVLATGGGGALPSFDGNPVAFVSAWLAWATVNARAAEAVYDLLLSKLPGLPTE